MKTVRIFLSEKFVEMLAGMCYLVIGGVQQGKIIHQYDGVQSRHLRLGQLLPHHIPHKEDPGLGVVDQMVDIAALELVQQRHGHGSVCQCGQKGHCPVGLIAGAYRYLVTALQAAHLQHDVNLFYSAGDIPEIKGDTIVVRKSGTVPVLLYTVLNNLIQ